MEPLICPQCGGQITRYSPGQTFTSCGYCSTTFLIETNKQKPADLPEPGYDPFESSGPNSRVVAAVILVVLFVFGGVLVLTISSMKKEHGSTTPVYGKSYSPTPVGRTSPAATPNPNLLEFGGKGTGNGLFQGTDSIAVDKQGRIYVADDSLRVQQFNDKGEFLKVLQIPSKTANYTRARQINKIAVADNGYLYVAVGGVILVYSETSTEAVRTIHVAPDYIQDFALRSDGGLLMISNNEKIETLTFVNKAGKFVRRINGFHTETADAVLSPPETGVVAIRLAVDGAGNIYSVYAFGDIGSYELSYDDDELMIFRFTPEGKYVNKFVKSMSSCGIEVDNQNRIYVSDDKSIAVYTNNGDGVSGVRDLEQLSAFALDKDNNIYALLDDKVIKRPAIQ